VAWVASTSVGESVLANGAPAVAEPAFNGRASAAVGTAAAIASRDATTNDTTVARRCVLRADSSPNIHEPPK
jgi:hypothetical protein